ncbi:MAG: acyltransferase [Alistipes sp.]|nr:acyltransferase [Alistipes sp.]
MQSNDDMRWSGKSRGGEFGHRFFILLIRTFGIRAAYCFLAFVVIYFLPAAPRATGAIWQYYRTIHGKGRMASFFSVVGHYYRFGQTLIDKIAIGSGLSGKYDFRFADYDRFIELLDSGKGVVLIGAHIGNWEAASVFFGKYASKMNIVLYDSEYQKIKEALRAGGVETPVNMIPVNGDGLENVIRIKTALDRGEYVGFQGDRFINEEKTFTREFMGRSARFPMGPFVTGSRLGVPVVFCYSGRAGGRKYRFIFREARADRSRGGEKPEAALLGQYIAATEEVVGQYPDQWFNFYKFWD